MQGLTLHAKTQLSMQLSARTFISIQGHIHHAKTQLSMQLSARTTTCKDMGGERNGQDREKMDGGAVGEPNGLCANRNGAWVISLLRDVRGFFLLVFCRASVGSFQSSFASFLGSFL